VKRFAELFVELDSTHKTGAKLAALERYFRGADPADAAWALHFLAGGKLMRAVTSAQMREWAAEETCLPPWLVEECEDAVGDLAEAVALLLPEPEGSEREIESLARAVEQRLLPLRTLDEPRRRELLVATWRALDATERLVWNKLITGSFRVGVARTLVLRAIAAVSGQAPETIAHRFMGGFAPSGDSFARLVAADEQQGDPGRPYPFFLAHPLAGEADLGGVPLDRWQVEWKWDGIRAQLVRRSGSTLVWSRGEEAVADRFPEVAAIGERLPDGTVLDGEILAWGADRPLPFQALQLRIGRLAPSAKLLREVPAVFLAFDVLEVDGVDVRSRPLSERRAALERLAGAAESPAFRLSPIVDAGSWDELARVREHARERNVEGFLLKRRDSAYGVGRVRGPWWKWKVDPYTVDAVLIHAQSGHGRRASLFTDYTFGLWDQGELVPFAKAYSGLTDAEIREVDAHVRRSTVARYGPVRVVRPELVFELAFEGLQPSARHRSGVAVRFPRIARWRRDKRPEDADTVAGLREILELHRSAGAGTSAPGSAPT
jgi:DNA ligase 1